MSAATKKLRAAVCRRADGACEHCGQWVGLNGEGGELDHFHSRRVEESLETCWLLCVACDSRKTENKPSATYWLGAFIEHCGKYGFAISRAEARLQSLAAKGRPG